jgi:hypothetical protein
VLRSWLFLCALGVASAFQAPVSAPPHAAADLARLVREAGLDPGECYRVRDLSFAKDDIKLYLNEGYLIFSKPAMGQRLSAVFTADVEGGDGEVLLIPPTRSERQSLASFTHSPTLDEHLSAALMIFTDGSADRLRDTMEQEGTGKKAPEMGPVLAEQWSSVAANILAATQLRLVEDLLATRPADTGMALFAVSGKTLGTFDILSDGRANRRIVVRQHTERNDRDAFNVWTDFLPRSVSQRNGTARSQPAENSEPEFTLANYRMDTEIGFDLGLKVKTRVAVRLGTAPVRAFAFEIARAMQVTAVRVDGAPAEVLRDDSLRGRITANGEEIEFLVVTPKALDPDTEHEFEFEHQGNVIATRGDGVYFVNARGSWYPHVGGGFATYDLTFRYPKRLTLVTSGDPVEDRIDGDWRITHRRTAVAIGAAGFNLGVYEKVTGTAAGVAFEVYGNRNLEDALRPKESILPLPPPLPTPARPMGPRFGRPLPAPPVIVPPDPLGRLRAVAQDLSSSLEFFTGLFGPPVMKTLTVAPIPGTFGQGFPGLVYLSTFAYLEASARPAALRSAREQVFFSDLMVPHEAAHQWWGSIIASGSQQDEWLLEALANYSSLLWLEKKKGAKEMEKVLDGYRDELLSKNADGDIYESAGPIVWGERLQSSSIPGAWRLITYDKGTWILHMLRRRMGDDAFLKMLAELRRRYEFKAVTTEDFQALARDFRPRKLPAEAVDTFFENWVYATGVPSLKLKYSAKGASPSVKLSGTVEQSSVDDDFTVDVPIEIQFAKGAAQTIWVRTMDGEKTFTVTLRQPPVHVAIPDDILMKK